MPPKLLVAARLRHRADKERDPLVSAYLLRVADEQPLDAIYKVARRE